MINEIRLGNRNLGFECWSGKDVIEFTAKQLKDMITAGKQKVCGLKLENGELVLDKEGFFTTNMMIHSHVNNYKPMEEGSMANTLYICMGSHMEDGKIVYDCISSRFEQAKFTEADMRAYLKIGIVSGGAKLEDDKIVLASMELEKPDVVKVKEPVPVKDKEETKPVAEEKAPEKKEETVKPVAKAGVTKGAIKK